MTFFKTLDDMKVFYFFVSSPALQKLLKLTRESRKSEALLEHQENFEAY